MGSWIHSHFLSDEVLRDGVGDDIGIEGVSGARDWYISLPTDKSALQRELRFCMSYSQANKLNQTAKWLGELLVTV